MQIAGFKLDRFKELSDVLRKEAKSQGFQLALNLTKAAWQTINSRGVGRSAWRARLRACYRCPVYDPKVRTCRKYDLGCGCYMPMKARLRDAECWTGFGWDHEKSPPVKEGSSSKGSDPEVA